MVMASSEEMPLELFLRKEIELISWKHGIDSTLRDQLPEQWVEIIIGGGSIGSVINEIWMPIKRMTRGFVSRLENLTVDLKIVLEEPNNAVQGLFYVTRSDGPIDGWFAGLPITYPEIESWNAQMEITLPSSIHSFFEIHNGLLENGNGGIGVYPLDQLVKLSEHDYLKAYDSDIAYERENFLEFASEPTGDVRCFDLTQESGKGDYLTIHWDHETQELSNPYSFWRYLKDFAVQILA